MKTRILAASFVIAALSLASCKKFLDPETPSLFTDTYIFSTESDASKAVNSVYALFNQDAFTSRVSNSWANNTDVEMGGVAGAPDLGRRDIWSFQATAGIGDLQTVWNNAYNAINRANECIEGIQKSSIGTTKPMRQLLGEAYALRAFWYYLLVNHWGDVPYKATPTKAGDEFYLPKTNRMEILTNCINDLKTIEPEMSWASEVQFGNERINRDFVLGFIARLALTRGGNALQPDMTMKREGDYLEYYKIANDACKKLVELKPHVLAPDMGAMFRNFCQYGKNDEVLYEVAFSPGFGDVAWATGIGITAGNHNYGSTTITTNFPITYYHSFDTTDLRLEATISRHSFNGDLVEVPAAFSSIFCAKWSRTYMGDKARGSASAKGTGINWPVMRYSDVLLMLAESENEISGPSAVAKDALAVVRRRAFSTDRWPEKVDAYIGNASASKEAFFDAIVNERAWEFGGECLRKYDLIRWNLFTKKVVETKAALNKIADESLAGTGTIPDYLYYKKASDGRTNIWLNKYNKPAVAPPVVNVPTTGANPDGWLRHAWAQGLASNRTSNASNQGGYIGWQFRGYTDESGATPVRYILPIHTAVVTASGGVLNNDGYGF